MLFRVEQKRRFLNRAHDPSLHPRPAGEGQSGLRRTLDINRELFAGQHPGTRWIALAPGEAVDRDARPGAVRGENFAKALLEIGEGRVPPDLWFDTGLEVEACPIAPVEKALREDCRQRILEGLVLAHQHEDCAGGDILTRIEPFQGFRIGREHSTEYAPAMFVHKLADPIDVRIDPVPRLVVESQDRLRKRVHKRRARRLPIHIRESGNRCVFKKRAQAFEWCLLQKTTEIGRHWLRVSLRMTSAYKLRLPIIYHRPRSSATIWR